MTRPSQQLTRPSLSYDRRLRAALSSESLLARPLSSRSKVIISSKSLQALRPLNTFLDTRPQELARSGGPEADDVLAEQVTAIKRRIDATCGRELVPRRAKPDVVVLAAITAQARTEDLRKKTFITESTSSREDVELYPNYGNEVRRKLAEAKAKGRLLLAPADIWPPSPVIRIYRH